MTADNARKLVALMDSRDRALAGLRNAVALPPETLTEAARGVAGDEYLLAEERLRSHIELTGAFGVPVDAEPPTIGGTTAGNGVVDAEAGAPTAA